MQIRVHKLLLIVKKAGTKSNFHYKFVTTLMLLPHLRQQPHVFFLPRSHLIFNYNDCTNNIQIVIVASINKITDFMRQFTFI